MRQLALPFAVKEGFAAADFVNGANSEAARAWLGRTGAWPQRRLAIYGDAGVGKSHLLHIWAARESAFVTDGVRLGGVGWPETVALAIDDADLVRDERALLHLLNGAEEARVPVLLAARAAPAQWPIELPDLRSRLRAIQAVAVEHPDDAMLGAIFARFLSSRQLIVRPDLQSWLLARLPRQPSALAEAAARLDRAALAAGRRVGRDIAARVLLELGLEAEEGAEAGRRSPSEPVLL